MVDMDSLAGVTALAAVGVAVWALVSRDSRTVVNIPDGFGQPDTDVPEDLQRPEDDNFQFEEGTEVWDEDRFDFGGPSEDSSLDAGSGPSSDIPDSLADFNPAGRVDLIGGNVSGSDNDRPYVGL